MPLALEKRRAFDRRRKAKQSEERAEIGAPEITKRQLAKGQELWKKCQKSLLNFNVLCFPNSTGLKPFGQVQLDSIAHDQEIILNGGTLCKAEPRGYGKTTRGVHAALWAGLYGYRQMVPIFSASLDKSKNQIMESWKTELFNNEFLFWMFPELIWGIRKLGNKPQAAASQTYEGKLTHIQWTASKIVLPYIKGIPGAGATFIALPLKSARGAIHALPNGKILRPELVIFDDVQKTEDADNPNTVRKLEELIEKDAMMLGGHSKKMSAIMNCTVIRPDDLSERFLNNPAWGRVRYKMLTSRATKEKELWLGQYADVLRACDPEDPEDRRRAEKEALAFYKSKKDEMDDGATITWYWGYSWEDDDPTEISAIQHAYNFLIDRGPDVFASECQNEPIRDTGGLTILTPEQIRKKQSGYGWRVIPPEVTTLTCFIDVHPQILYYNVWAWEPRFTGFLIDYGTFPDQKRRAFNHGKLPVSLENIKRFSGLDDDARVTVALETLIHGSTELGINSLLNREWTKTDGVPLKIAMCGIDANGLQADAVKKFVRQSPYSAILYPSFGRGIGASGIPMSQWQQSKKWKCGPEWVPTKGNPGDPPGVTFDTNYWKTRFHRALALEKGSQGALYVYKVENDLDHRMLSEHWYSERPKEVTHGARTVYEFPRSPLGDNHLFDCAVGAMVAASKAGIASVKKTQKLDMEARARRLRELARKR